MLVLSRKYGESIIVGDRFGHEPMLQITVLAVSGGRVKLGFEASGDVPVHRLEVWRRATAKSRRTSSAATPRTLRHTEGKRVRCGSKGTFGRGCLITLPRQFRGVPQLTPPLMLRGGGRQRGSPCGYAWRPKRRQVRHAAYGG